MSMQLVDTLDRPIRDLRISVTDRCNFRCTYCMPKEIFNREYKFLPRELLLSFEEIVRLIGVSASIGVEKVRITGGEPLLRRGIETLISDIAAIEDIRDICLTTNGSLLPRQAEVLAAAGLDRVTVSLDSLDDETFMLMNDAAFPVSQVLEGIEAAAAAGLVPLKVNMVVKKGINDSSIIDMAKHFRGTGHVVRFIEYMDVGMTNGWRVDEVVSSAEIIEKIGSCYPLELVDSDYLGEVAQRYRYVDGGGEIGVISSVTAPFCGDCTRARISAEGNLYTCLFASSSIDLREPLRAGASDDDLRDLLVSVWKARSDRYSERRSEATLSFPKVEMSYIGG